MTKSHDVRSTMSMKAIHDQWESAYLGADSVPFHQAAGDVFERTFDLLLSPRQNRGYLPRS